MNLAAWLTRMGHYVSTYCLHGDHERCRRVCKTCQRPCRCDCGHVRPEAGRGDGRL